MINIAADEEKLSQGTVIVGVEITTRSIGVDDYKVLNVQKSLDELERLVETAGGYVIARVVQSKSAPDPRTYIGSGKLEEIKELCVNTEAKLVIFDTELSPSQIRNLEDGIGGVTVIDRSMLILDIFALHATTGEGKLQVELAQLRYTAPRLTGKGTELSRLGGGIGTRGPGESKLESDKRHISRRIMSLESDLGEMEKNRRTIRASRDKSNIPNIAIVGYTNAGKSTLLNYLTDAGILVADKLFATLDPTTRKLKLPCGEEVLLTDTVGFISRLPHHVIKAFKSTLDEAVYADILMIVSDASDADVDSHISITLRTLDEIGACGKPIIHVFNKCDKVAGELPLKYEASDAAEIVYISALSGSGIDELLSAIERVVLATKKSVTFKIPNSASGVINTIYKNATVESIHYGDTHVVVKAMADERVRGMLKEYIAEDDNV